jgi:DNA polymerase-1
VTTALLDADIVAYRAAAASEKDIPWGDGEDGKTTSPEAAALSAVDIAHRWMRKIGARSAIACFSPRDGQAVFRRAICPSYKANRKGEKPAAYLAAVEALEREFKTVRIDNLEADDVMGILATNGTIPTPVIVSIDKDMQGIPGFVFNPTKDTRPRKIKAETADFFWMYQTLIGDAIDGYKGCPGVGPVKAKQALLAGLASGGTAMQAAHDLFLSRDLTTADFVLQARLARILRAEDFDNTHKRIRLWHPNPSNYGYLELPLDLSASTRPQAAAASPKSPASSRRRSTRSSSSPTP